MSLNLVKLKLTTKHQHSKERKAIKRLPTRTMCLMQLSYVPVWQTLTYFVSFPTSQWRLRNFRTGGRLFTHKALIFTTHSYHYTKIMQQNTNTTVKETNSTFSRQNCCACAFRPWWGCICAAVVQLCYKISVLRWGTHCIGLHVTSSDGTRRSATRRRGDILVRYVRPIAKPAKKQLLISSARLHHFAGYNRNEH